MPLIKEFSTIAEMFFSVVDTLKDTGKDAFRRKADGKYVGISYADLYVRVEAFALALRSLGISKGDRIGIVSENRLEWVIADFACACSGLVDVPIFSTLTPAQVEYIFNDAEVKAVICSNRLQLGKLLKVAENIPTLQSIIVFQEDAIQAAQGTTKRELLSFNALLEEGRKLAETVPGQLGRLAAQAVPDDLLTLIYTSGTTGNPKGVMLTHGNFSSNVVGAARAFPIDTTDVVLSYLPLCHSYERTGGYYTCFACGVTIAFADSIETVSENLLEVRPTLMTSVPYLFEKIKMRVERKIATEPAKKQRLIRWAIATGIARFRATASGRTVGPILAAKHVLAEKLVLSKIRQFTGGRVRFFVSGGGPLSPEIAEFFFGIGLKIVEGYGLTETSPILSFNPVERPKIGTVGLPIFNVEIKIAEDGEILARGPNIMRGYYKDPAATAEAIDEQGWLHTGDIGRFDEDNYLKITDRKKHLIVTSGGKNVAPAPIEATLEQSRFVQKVMLIGDNRPFMTALIVPDYETLKEVAQEHGLSVGSIEDLEVRRTLIDYDPVELAIEGDLRGLQRNLAAFERVRRYRLLDEPFTVENGMLTPTLKVKRKVVEGRYKEEIDKMYEGADEG